MPTGLCRPGTRRTARPHTATGPKAAGDRSPRGSPHTGTPAAAQAGSAGCLRSAGVSVRTSPSPADRAAFPGIRGGQRADQVLRSHTENARMEKARSVSAPPVPDRPAFPAPARRTPFRARAGAWLSHTGPSPGRAGRCQVLRAVPHARHGRPFNPRVLACRLVGSYWADLARAPTVGAAPSDAARGRPGTRPPLHRASRHSGHSRRLTLSEGAVTGPCLPHTNAAARSSLPCRRGYTLPPAAGYPFGEYGTMPGGRITLTDEATGTVMPDRDEYRLFAPTRRAGGRPRRRAAVTQGAPTPVGPAATRGTTSGAAGTGRPPPTAPTTPGSPPGAPP